MILSPFDTDPYYEHPARCPECGERDVILTEHECPPSEDDYGAVPDDEHWCESCRYVGDVQVCDRG